MREIKFRGQSDGTVPERGTWAYGYLLPRGLGKSIYSEIPGGFQEVPVIPETVGQYTGIKDSTGKEVYEGDIIKTNFDDVGVVAMGEHNGVNGREAFNIGFYIIWDSFDDRSWMRNELLYFIKKIGVTVIGTVIGNRWDNPELLGGAHDEH